MPQLDWIMQMIAKDHPDRIKIMQNGQEALSDAAKAIVNMAEAWNTKRGSARSRYLEKAIPPELKAALKNAEKKQVPRGGILYTAEKKSS